MKLVLLLGAGFSRAFGLPVMREFFSHVNESPVIDSKDKDFVRNLRLSARAGASMLDGMHDNLEHVLSFALMSSRRQNEAAGELSNYDRLRVILQRVYAPLSFELYQQLPELLGPVIGKEPGKRWDQDLTIITTNYDLIAEFALWSMGIAPSLPMEYSFSHVGDAKGTCLYSPNGPKLCKLHGSLNWFVSNETGSPLRIEGRVVPVTGRRPQDRGWFLPLMCTGDYFNRTSPNAPLIIPPTLYKQHREVVFEPIWRVAQDALAQADRIAVIGYSFPISDTYMKYFFACSLVENADLPSIDVIDPSADKIVGRLREAGSDFGSHFKQMLNPINGEWQKTGYSLVKPR